VWKRRKSQDHVPDPPLAPKVVVDYIQVRSRVEEWKPDEGKRQGQDHWRLRKVNEAKIDAESSRGFPDLLLLSTTTSLLDISGFPTAETHTSSLLLLLRVITILPSEMPPPRLSATI